MVIASQKLSWDSGETTLPRDMRDIKMSRRAPWVPSLVARLKVRTTTRASKKGSEKGSVEGCQKGS